MGSLDQKVQTDLPTPSKHLCFPQGVPKRGSGSFNPQDLLRDSPIFRGFGRELDGAGGGEELAGARNNA